MTALPNTKTKGAGRRWPLFVLFVVALVALALVLESFLRAEDFTPGEEIVSPSIRDVSVSAEDRLYPPPDVNYFGQRPEKVFVYLSVEDLPTGEDMRARVARSGSSSALSLLFGQEDEIQALDEQEDQLSSGEGGASGIVKFALQARSGDPLPPGNYTVEISDGLGGESGAPAVRKSFVVEG
ncbi:MAG: hypothetical protein CYG60_23260 [Actinobacteria bacterium]|nr:hypothetical protein [Actinomycetota bacterium]PLS82921.1 MAG: hypothetical protein CYG60_23260 [Actinomycetota bacterium]